MNTFLLRKYTTRVNLVLTLCFFLSLGWAYADYYHKKQTYINLPWYAFFFQVKPATSWQVASPFSS